MTYQKHTLQTIIIFTYERCHNQRGITAFKEMDKCVKISNPFVLSTIGILIHFSFDLFLRGGVLRSYDCLKTHSKVL